jgi:hypothetical protein
MIGLFLESSGGILHFRLDFILDLVARVFAEEP